MSARAFYEVRVQHWQDMGVCGIHARALALLEMAEAREAGGLS